MADTSEKGFVRELSLILIVGVGLSFAIEIIGLAWYFLQTGGLVFDFTPQWQLTAESFFSYIVALFSNSTPGVDPLRLMALGIVVLMLTPYIRVIASAVHFGTTRNLKYLLFTLFVLGVLTVSLSIR
jgi:uncharacterized membrane protein